MAANYFIALQSGVLRGSKYLCEKIKIRRIVGNSFVWVLKLVADVEGGKEADGVSEHGAEENIWTYGGRSNGGTEEIA